MKTIVMEAPAPAPAPPVDLANERLRAGLCPDCGGPMRKYYLPNGNDPGDVDPAADCLDRACGWGY